MPEDERNDFPNLDELAQHLRALVEAESPTSDPSAARGCAEVITRLSKEMLDAAPEHIVLEGRTHLRWRFGTTDTRVMMLGHFDTVWPVGTLEWFPFTVAGTTASGPGIFDMKTGILQLFLTLRALENLDGISVLLTSDEEIGAPTSRALIEAVARSSRSVLVFEPSLGGALKVARKGAAAYQLRARGRASHAGLDPESGINAALELAHQIVRLGELPDSAKGTTVTPTLLAAGNSRNTVPADASTFIDVRAATEDEQARVDRALRELTPVVEGARLEVERLSFCPPLQREATKELFALAVKLAKDLGWSDLEGVSVGGASDGNLTAAVGTPTLDGLGAVGGKAHAEGEFVLLDEIPERTRLSTEITRRLQTVDYESP